jgi:large subunit ribosomal protein L29
MQSQRMVSQSDRDDSISKIFKPMAKQKLEGLAEMSDADLATELEGSEALYRKMKFEHAVKGLANPMDLRELRRNIARINTEVRRKWQCVLKCVQDAVNSNDDGKESEKNACWCCNQQQNDEDHCRYG